MKQVPEDVQEKGRVQCQKAGYWATTNEPPYRKGYEQGAMDERASRPQYHIGMWVTTTGGNYSSGVGYTRQINNVGSNDVHVGTGWWLKEHIRIATEEEARAAMWRENDKEQVSKSTGYSEEDMKNAAWWGCHGYNEEEFKQWLKTYQPVEP